MYESAGKDAQGSGACSDESVDKNIGNESPLLHTLPPILRSKIGGIDSNLP